MKAIALLVLFLLSAVCRAQTHVDTTYRVELTATASPVINLFRAPSVPGTDHKASLGYGMFVRGMWHPGRLLSIGFMTGYVLIDREEIPIDRSLASQSNANLNYSARLESIPLQLAITMQKHDFELGIGMGPYLMLTTIEGGNSASGSGSRLELGLTFFGSYSFSLNDNIKIGPELRVLYLRYRGIISLMPSCSLRIDALRY